MGTGPIHLGEHTSLSPQKSTDGYLGTDSEDRALLSRPPVLELDTTHSTSEEGSPPAVTQVQHRPTQGDWVLIREMDPSRPDIVHALSQLALSFDDSEDESSEDESRSTYAESIFSQESTLSSATGASATSGYTEAEIVTATKELVNIFLEDAVTSQLYRRAIEDPHIGPDRLKRNFYRLLRIYSQNLHREAQGELEHLASQLVAAKARYMAQCVVERFHTEPHRKIGLDSKEESDHEDAEEDHEIALIDEDRFEDLVVLREFLVGSSAFGLFQEQLKSFVQPKDLKRLAEELRLSPDKDRTDDPVQCITSPAPLERVCEKESHDNGSRPTMKGRVRRYCEAFLVAIALVEPPLLPGTARLRWSCVSQWLEPFNRVQPQRHFLDQMLTSPSDAAIAFSVMFTSIDLVGSKNLETEWGELVART